MERVFDLNVGNRVWLMHKDRPVQGTITKIMYKKFFSCLDYDKVVEHEWYYVKIDDREYVESYEKKALFPTKEDLIKSL